MHILQNASNSNQENATENNSQKITDNTIQAKQGNKPPIQTKEGQKPPIQAKQQVVQRTQGSSPNNGGGDEARIKQNVSQLTGTDVTQAKVHYNSSKPAQFKAEGIAQGNNIHLAPGKTQHLGHELTHVAQQQEGRVAPTTQANNGASINNDPKLEKEADDIGAKAHQMSASNPMQLKTSDNASQGAGASAIVQKKGSTPLMPEIVESVTDALSTPPPIHLHTFQQRIIHLVNAYDNSTDGRPSEQARLLQQMLDIVSNYHYGRIEQGLGHSREALQLIHYFKSVLRAEMVTVGGQERRLNDYTKDNDAPYKQMTDEGMLWKHESYEHNTENIGKTGKAYFEHLSEMNRDSMTEEIKDNDLDTQEWFPQFVKRAQTALSSAVVNHYTTESRAEAMLAGGGMKSKMMLEKDLATFKHNTSIYDDLGLANSGFVFFFIESPNAPLRGTRFSQDSENQDDKAARISIPIGESGLLQHGWLMLSDFAQREYPDIMTTSKDDKHASTLPTRKQEHLEKKPSFDKQVRHFQGGLAPLTMEEMESTMDMSQNKRQAYTAVTPQVKGDSDSKQVYTNSDTGKKLEVPDRIFNNILVGNDIIPGIATRAGLEVARIMQVNPALGAQLSKLDGDALMLFMLKDLFRPQAMIPNQVIIGRGNIQVAD
ncbi:hypothetical protein BKI52_29985 [marine bacterium AO1-C]|nr:hypothetical protein BKI52_29985 [marine bacterium AO1-C]